ncbi:LacI family DNA-binding transcriptional regulator [Microbacter sp. GSS18]|nr:LacI family DNA-binding transcriptional regulator [Microbacter sp. GSS18]
MVSIDEVARAAGVSTATVSRALSGRGHVSEKTRARVDIAAKSLGYVVSSSASSLASGRTRNIGVLLPFLDRWFFSTVLAGIADRLMRDGYDITLYSLSVEREQRDSIFEEFLRRRRVDGVIAISLELDADEIQRLCELDLPVVTIGGPNPGLSSLTVDDMALAQLATEHLIALGHRRIAHIGADPESDVDFHIPGRRRVGFEQTLEAAGIPIYPNLYEPGDFTIEGGFHSAKQLLGRPGPQPTAVFASSDEMAIGTMLAARELGYRVPEDLSVVGIDGHELGAFFQLTTVDQAPRAQGERAAEAILAALEETGAENRMTVAVEPQPYQLVVRGSTARPSADTAAG